MEGVTMAKKLQKSPDFSDFFNNLIDICNSRNTTPTALAERYASRSVLTAWKNGTINANIVPKLALDLNVSINDFFIKGKEKSPSAEQKAKEQLSFDEDEQELLNLYRPLSEKDKARVTERARTLYDLADEKRRKPELIPMYYVDDRVSAGFGASLSDYEHGQTVYVPATAASRRADFILKVSGDSMEPKFHDNDYVLVRSCQSIDIGEIGIFETGSEGYIKKLGKNALISLNKKYPSIPITEETVCFGLVLGTTDIVTK